MNSEVKSPNLEVLQNPENNRLAVFPLKFSKIWKAYKKQQAAFWTAEEVDLSKDASDFEKLNDNEKHFIKMVLGFFAASDGIVNLNLGDRFMADVEVLEAKIAYSFQMMMENIHSEMYSLMIDNIIKEPIEKNKLLNAISNYPCISKKAKWAINWIGSKDCFAKRLIAFAIVEGIFFSGSFCSIFWLKKKNLMPGLCQANELISRDEASHTDFACLLYEHIKDKPSKEEIEGMFREAVMIEKEFICESLPCSLLGMNSELMSQYIEYVADRLLCQLGYQKVWGTANPFDFMESISLEGKTNFFEHRVSQYQLSSVLNEGRENIFETDDDF
jgi:ribonucleotide reductase beta subunit family protein with ferritin-like domain